MLKEFCTFFHYICQSFCSAIIRCPIILSLQKKCHKCPSPMAQKDEAPTMTNQMTLVHLAVWPSGDCAVEDKLNIQCQLAFPKGEVVRPTALAKRSSGWGTANLQWPGWVMLSTWNSPLQNCGHEKHVWIHACHLLPTSQQLSLKLPVGGIGRMPFRI